MTDMQKVIIFRDTQTHAMACYIHSSSSSSLLGSPSQAVIIALQLWIVAKLGEEEEGVRESWSTATKVPMHCQSSAHCYVKIIYNERDEKVPKIMIIKCQISAVGCNLYYTACSGHQVKLPCWTLEAELLTKKFFLYLPLVMTWNRWIPLLENCHWKVICFVPTPARNHQRSLSTSPPRRDDSK